MSYALIHDILVVILLVELFVLCKKKKSKMRGRYTNLSGYVIWVLKLLKCIFIYSNLLIVSYGSKSFELPLNRPGGMLTGQ